SGGARRRLSRRAPRQPARLSVSRAGRIERVAGSLASTARHRAKDAAPRRRKGRDAGGGHRFGTKVFAVAPTRSPYGTIGVISDSVVERPPSDTAHPACSASNVDATYRTRDIVILIPRLSLCIAVLGAGYFASFITPPHGGLLQSSLNSSLTQ